MWRVLFMKLPIDIDEGNLSFETSYKKLNNSPKCFEEKYKLSHLRHCFFLYKFVEMIFKNIHCVNVIQLFILKKYFSFRERWGKLRDGVSRERAYSIFFCHELILVIKFCEESLFNT